MKHSALVEPVCPGLDGLMSLLGGECFSSGTELPRFELVGRVGYRFMQLHYGRCVELKEGQWVCMAWAKTTWLRPQNA